MPLYPFDKRRTIRTEVLKDTIWTFDQIELGLGRFAEVAFFHKRSHTLLVTDSIVSIPEEPPVIVELDPYPLHGTAKGNASDVIADTKANRCKGWQRISLLTFYFQPSVLGVRGWGDTISRNT